LAEGASLRATARIVERDKDTVCGWLPRLGRHCGRLLDYFFRDLHLSECQLDELWTFVYKKEDRLTALEKLAGRYGDTWIWTAFDPVCKVVPAWRVGKRTLGEATQFIKALKNRLDEHMPFFTSDDLPHYADALLEVYGVVHTPPRRFPRGRPPSPRLIPPPDLVYAVVVKEREGGQVVRVTTRIVYGTEAQVRQQLRASPVSDAISTYGVERNRLRRDHPSTFAPIGAEGECLFQETPLSEVSTRVGLCLLSLLLSTRRLASKTGTADPNEERPRLTQEVASGLTRNGCRPHRPCLDDG
jgi:IS1 family transposase